MCLSEARLLSRITPKHKLEKMYTHQIFPALVFKYKFKNEYRHILNNNFVIKRCEEAIN